MMLVADHELITFVYGGEWKNGNFRSCRGVVLQTDRIHVWYISLHLPYKNQPFMNSCR